MKGHVYIIQMLGTDYYKIGMTTQDDPYKRIKDAETYAPLGIKEIKIIESVYPSKLEKELHEDFKHKRQKGEWFELDRDDLKLIEDKYSVSRGKILKTLEKLLILCKNEELLYSILKTELQSRVEVSQKGFIKDVLKIVKEDFKNKNFTASELLEVLKEKNHIYKDISYVAIGRCLSKHLPKKRFWLNGKSVRLYLNEKN